MELERFVRQLVASLEARDPAGVHRPLSVAQLRDRVLPYRLHRAVLGLSSNEDYELLVLRLVAEEDGWVRTFPPEAAERARREVAEANPDLDLTDALGDATVQIGAAAIGRLRLLEAEALARAAEPVPVLTAEPAIAEPSLPAVPNQPAAPAVPDLMEVASPPPAAPPAAEPVPLFEALEDGIPLAPPTPQPPVALPALSTCPACTGRLPEGRPVVYCPHCGERVGTLRCVRCGTELEPGWRHCVMCGHRMPAVDTALA